MTYNNMEIKRRYFKIALTNPGGLLGNKVGFIDPLKAQDYQDFSSTTGTLEQYKAKAMGYIRWRNLSLELSRFGIFYMEVTNIAGATSLTTPSSVDLMIGLEQANEGLRVVGEDGTIYTDTDAIKYLAAYVLTHSYEGFAHVFDPTIDAHGRNPSGKPIGIIEPFFGSSTDYPVAGAICNTISEAMTSYISVVEFAKLTVQPIPADATVTLTAASATQDGNSIMVHPGDTVTYTVSKTGLKTETGTVEVYNDKVVKIELRKPNA